MSLGGERFLDGFCLGLLCVGLLPVHLEVTIHFEETVFVGGNAAAETI